MNQTTATPEVIDVNAPAPAAQELERLAGEVIGIGRAWAAHGLTIGRSALEVSARSLDVTARLLGDLARRFEPTQK